MCKRENVRTVELFFGAIQRRAGLFTQRSGFYIPVCDWHRARRWPAPEGHPHAIVKGRLAPTALPLSRGDRLFFDVRLGTRGRCPFGKRATAFRFPWLDPRQCLFNLGDQTGFDAAGVAAVEEVGCKPMPLSYRCCEGRRQHPLAGFPIRQSLSTLGRPAGSNRLCKLVLGDVDRLPCRTQTPANLDRPVCFLLLCHRVQHNKIYNLRHCPL